MVQDSTLNNLVDPPGYQTAKLGTLGGVIQRGSGSKSMILIPGLGFSGNVLNGFMEKFSGEYRMYAVTLPGFGGTPAPPCPPEKTSLGEQTWTNAALGAIEKLIEEEKLKDPVVVGHWLTGTQLALRLAMKHPGKIKGVILLSGVARMYVGDSTRMASINTLAKRVAFNDNIMAPKWFKTVTRETWDDNNFLPGDYAVNPRLGLRLWREAASPKLHVWIRYLCEFNSQDISFDLDKLTVPTLLLKPGLEGVYHDPANHYLENYLHKSWVGSAEKNPVIAVKIIPDSRICPWIDKPEEVSAAVLDFLNSLNTQQR
jgi:pimeloyl-ACP methyl ester carboxylesterase